ncbi:Non-heme chloroperoxidase [compost metagenome]
MFFLASRGYRCIAHDRRGHGRSSQPWNGNDMDTYADDLATLIIHGDDDQIVPMDAAGRASAKIGRNATIKVYPGAPHGLADAHKEPLNADLLAFVRA